MIEHISDDRRIVPRWRLSAVTIMAGETEPIRSRTSHSWLGDKSELLASLAAWTQRPLPSRAVELISAALLYQTPEAGKEAAEFLLQESEVGAIPQSLAARLLTELEPTVDPVDSTLYGLDRGEDHQNIRDLRAALKRNPHNPLGWADLAHAHASCGNLDAANHSMRIALASSPQNRMIIRSASRLYVHSEEPDRAHRLLYDAEAVRSDPWLLAAELAIASLTQRTSRLTRIAKRLVKDDSLKPFHRTELASALGTLEMEAGRDRKARQLFQLSLTDPTDNSVAQAQWASRQFDRLTITGEKLNIRRGFEARADHAFANEDWHRAIREAWSWLSDEPFSSRPAVFGSYVASVGSMDFMEAVRFAKEGLRANPSDPILLNNLVFALAQSDHIEEANEHFKLIRKPRDSRIDLTLLATEGLLCYRRGEIERGRKLYKEAIAIAKDVRDRRALALASMFFAYEELSSRNPDRGLLRDVIQTLSRPKLLPELTHWLTRLEPLLDPSMASEIRQQTAPQRFFSYPA